MKTLNEQIKEVMQAATSKTEKINDLIKLGIDSQEIDLLFYAYKTVLDEVKDIPFTIGIEMPPKEIIEAAAFYNPHGFGFCTPNKFYKTLSFNAFIKNIKKIDKNEPAILHFRYATHGSIKRKNCHPFKNENIFFAHNGVVNVKPINDMTDSETLFKTDVMNCINKYGFNYKKLEKTLKPYSGYSKFAIMKNAQIKTFGEFTELDGYLYSNLRFLNYYNDTEKQEWRCLKKANLIYRS